jgi:hypothetical protein
MRYVIGFLVTIGLIILVIMLLFRGGSDVPEAPAKADLTSYSDSSTAVVQYTVDSPVTAAEDHFTTQITVGKDEARITIFQGYDGQVVRSQAYPTGQNAYAVFLHSLKNAGFTLGNDSEELRDERGYCPTGSRYIYEVVDGSSTKSRYWSTSCKVGTFKGNKSTIKTLFEDQIPDYGKVTSGYRR